MNVFWCVVGFGCGNYSSQYYFDVGLIDVSVNELNSLINVVLCVIYVFGVQQCLRYIGEVFDFGLCWMDFFVFGDLIMIGIDIWCVFFLLQCGIVNDFGNISVLVGYVFWVVE